MKTQPIADVMRHPQDNLLVVYALSLLAQEYEGTQKEDWALHLAVEIGKQHGLTSSETIHQLE
ncbi:hypothetical protein C483_07973 [Natrialba hulunbeirensis JCM 10989]|uniref:Uncharacterized protein n=2 Tax=Natrialba hulunbeirensis TaxID=123783 RepID=M0A224_9EURY|nr:hypothetical protein C483_07973 [Natrialba hulunbeirensis JCM 10989]